jgi:photosystem II stability/assembly factor-like uncharacterized protein
VLAARARGWALCVGQPGAGNQGKAVFETADAGRTWRLGLHVRSWARRARNARLPEGNRVPSGRTRVALGEPGSAVPHEGRRYYVLLQTNGRFRLVTTHDGGADWRTVHRWG